MVPSSLVRDEHTRLVSLLVGDNFVLVGTFSCSPSPQEEEGVGWQQRRWPGGPRETVIP